MPIRWAYLKRVLAGAIFGLYMAHLLYFLNPQVDITAARLALVTLVYGITCGLLFGTLLWILRGVRVRFFGRPDPQRTHGFGFVVFAAFASALIYWVHLTFLRIYLPIGAIRVLSKATNAIAVTAFVLLALWVIERSAERRRSRAIVVCGIVLVAVSSIFLYQRRESYRTERKEVVVATVAGVGEHREVLLVAIRNLPFDWIVTMRGEGLLPYFDVRAGKSYFTRLEPFPTTSPKPLWASLATGKLPFRHGVTGRYSYRTPLNRKEPFLLLPYGVGFRAWGLIPPVERISAQSPSGSALPVWEMFRRVQLTADLVAWPSVDTRRIEPLVPPDAASRFAFTGGAAPRIATALAADLAALDAIDGRAALSVAGIEGFSEAQRALHIFTNELPPRGTPKGDALRAYAQELDRALLSLATRYPDHLLVLCSPSGVVPPELPANAWALAMQSLRRDSPGADDGFVLMSGPAAVHRENPKPAYETDIVPTILFAAGLPVGRDMDGAVLTDAFSEEMLRGSTLSAIQTYEAERVVVRRTGT